MIADKLFEKVEKNGVVCVGLDTSLDYIPEEFKSKFSNESDMLFAFNKEIIDATLDVSACFKVQIAYYEALGLKGLEAYKNTLSYLREKNALIIADIKRGDIAATAKMYAKAHFEGDFESDFITLNPYMGMDSIDPYLPYIEKNEKGVFVLVRTSNKGAEDIEYLEAGNGKKVYDVVGEKLNTLGKNYLGKHGYSSIGGVVGCTHQEEAKEMRDKLQFKENQAVNIKLFENHIQIEKSKTTCCFCGSEESLELYKNFSICNSCLSDIVDKFNK